MQFAEGVCRLGGDCGVMEILVLLAAGFVAFTNGANANCKGVASLYGSGTTTLRLALWWGTLTTFLGSVSAVFLSGGMLKAFSGQGIVDNGLLQRMDFLVSVAAGAAATSFLATRLSFPVSTTHALVGALVGAGLAGGQSGVQWQGLRERFVFPLLFSPMVALVLGCVVYGVLRRLRLAPEQRTVWLDISHFFSTGAASFARGLNDAPKMAALLTLVPWLSAEWSIFLVAVLMAVGGLLDSKNVAETLGRRVTGMDAGQGFAASLVTAVLVGTASLHSLPASTTHVSVGALAGMGLASGRARWGKVFEILLAWLTTVPCGAVLAALIFGLLRLF